MCAKKESERGGVMKTRAADMQMQDAIARLFAALFA